MAFFDRFRRKRSGRRAGRSGAGRRRPDRARRPPDQATELLQGGAAPPPPPVPEPVRGTVPAPLPPVQAPAAPMPAPMPAPQPAQSSSDPARTVLSSIPSASGGSVVAVLIGIEGKLKDEVFKVTDGENILGRMQTAEICFGDLDDRISRQHAQIVHRQGNFALRPLKDDNPTYLNGQVVEKGAALTDGDQLGVGNSTFKFRVV